MSLPRLPPSLEELGLDDSITIPHLPTSDLCGFVYCIILSVGSALIGNVWCSTYEDGIEVSWDRRYTCMLPKFNYRSCDILVWSFQQYNIYIWMEW